MINGKNDKMEAKKREIVRKGLKEMIVDIAKQYINNPHPVYLSYSMNSLLSIKVC